MKNCYGFQELPREVCLAIVVSEHRVYSCLICRVLRTQTSRLSITQPGLVSAYLLSASLVLSLCVPPFVCITSSFLLLVQKIFEWMRMWVVQGSGSFAGDARCRPMDVLITKCS